MSYQEKTVRCVCGCHAMTFSKFADDNTVSLEVYENAFYGRYKSKIRLYFKRLWTALRGEEYMLFDIVLSPEDVKGLRDALVDMTTERD